METMSNMQMKLNIQHSTVNNCPYNMTFEPQL